MVSECKVQVRQGDLEEITNGITATLRVLWAEYPDEMLAFVTGLMSGALNKALEADFGPDPECVQYHHEMIGALQADLGTLLSRLEDLQ